MAIYTGSLPFLKRKCNFREQSQKLRRVKSSGELWIRKPHPGSEMSPTQETLLPLQEEELATHTWIRFAILID